MSGIPKHARHGMCDTPEYNAWRGMHARCTGKGNANHKNYGGRGITVCKRWGDFKAFFADMGARPKGKSLDRINNNGNYTPSNCRWATALEQGQNTRRVRLIRWNGKTQPMRQWERDYNLPNGVLHHRLATGLHVSKALFPVDTTQREAAKRGCKFCGGCGMEKKITDFYPVREHKNGRKSVCKPCDNAESIERYHERRRKAALLRRLGA